MVLYGDTDFYQEVANGWGIPTATDIALAWLVARVVFGKNHPAVNFLLLLAVADDAIGLGIIAVFYPDPSHPVNAWWLLLVLLGMTVAYFLRRVKVNAWWPYLAFAGLISWHGLILAHLHPALALVFIVPFMPGPEKDTGFYQETDGHSALENFEHQLKLPVDFGLFFFGLVNAGVAFSAINEVTFIVLSSLIVGKTLGITLFSGLGALFFPLPKGMGIKHLVVAGLIAGLGLTVALFVSGEAFPNDSVFQGPAKMGAVFSVIVAFLAIALGTVLKVKQK